MKVHGVDFVMYLVSDLARAACFYRNVLSLRQTVYTEEWKWAEFDCGNVTLALKGGEQLPEGTTTGGRLALAVDDVHRAHAELKQQGVRIVSAPCDYSVCVAMEILDPDGNTVILHKRADGTAGVESHEA